MKIGKLMPNWPTLLLFGLFLAGCGSSGSDGPPPIDTDNDGIADAVDTDDDNDGVDDTADAFPLDANESADADGDGTGDNADTDDDNDGVEDGSDAFPFDPNESADSDGDGTGDNADAFPNDATETADNDNDGTGDNADTDDDNDGVEDANDAFPLDSSETLDTDNDGIGNNADTDDDNDGVADTDDAFPLDTDETVDTDGDGIGNNADTDDDNDGTLDANDDFPLNAARTMPIQPLFPVVNGQFQLPGFQAAMQLEWIIDELNDTETTAQEINDRFDPAAIASIPVADWQNFIASLRSALAGAIVQDIITMTPTSVRVLLGRTGEPGSGYFVTLATRYGSGLITSFGASQFNLNGSSVRSEDQSLTLEQAADKIETLAEDVAVLVAEIDASNQCVPIFARRADQPMGIASIFKIWVMGAVANAIEAGQITADQVLTLDADQFVLGSGLNDEPAGIDFSVRDMAILMLGISDNTATEHLINLAGKPAIETVLSAFGHMNLDAILPFLSMSEAFHLYFTVPLVDAEAYLTLAEQAQRNYVDTTLTPLGPVTSFPTANRSVLVKGLWQASANDICAAMAGLRQYNDTSDAFAVIDQAYGAETALVNLRSNWERVWFKGGSLSDGIGNGQRVLSYGWMLESDSRGAFSVVVITNNDSGGNARIDQSLVGSVAGRILDIVNATN